MKGSELFAASAAIVGVILLVVSVWRRPPLRPATGWVVPSVVLYAYLAAGLAAVPLSILLVVILGPGFFGSGLGGLRIIEYAIYLTTLSIVAFVLYSLGNLVMRRPAAAAVLALLLHAPLTLGVGPVVADAQLALQGAEATPPVDPSDLRLDLRRVGAERDAGGQLISLVLVVDVYNAAPVPAHLRSWRIHGLPAPAEQVLEDVLKAGGTLGPPLSSRAEPVLIDSGATRLTFALERSILTRLDVPDGHYSLTLDVGTELIVGFEVATR